MPTVIRLTCWLNTNLAAMNIFRANHPIWKMSFRIFFALGAVSAILLMELWHHPSQQINVLWHAHEMLYGFMASMIAGFVFTASQNWSGLPGIHGRKLQVLAFLWLAARLAGVFSDSFLLKFFTNESFWLLSLYWLLPYLLKQQPKRNLEFIFFLSAYAVGSGLMQLQMASIANTATYGIRLGIDTTLLIVFLIGGRVIPYFTQKGIADTHIDKKVWIERSSVFLGYLFLISDVAGFTPQLSQALCWAMAGIHSLRFSGWHFWKTIKNPIIAVLHSAYLWVIVGFILKALNLSTTHAFAVGGMSVLIYGMIVRVALGHTGRPIVASAGLTLGFVLINLAALLRVTAEVSDFEFQSILIKSSSGIWMIAFVIYLGGFWKILVSEK